MKSITKSSALLTAVLLFAAFSASAVMVTWEGTNGVSATVNWSDPLNWYSINTANQTTPVANAANFTWLTAVQTSNLTTVNVDGAYNTPGTSINLSGGIISALSLDLNGKPSLLNWTAGTRQMSFKGRAYLLHFGLLNFYFHATTAYNILRHRGVELGKRDFLGSF